MLRLVSWTAIQTLVRPVSAWNRRQTYSVASSSVRSMKLIRRCLKPYSVRHRQRLFVRSRLTTPDSRFPPRSLGSLSRRVEERRRYDAGRRAMPHRFDRPFHLDACADREVGPIDRRERDHLLQRGRPRGRRRTANLGAAAVDGYGYPRGLSGNSERQSDRCVERLHRGPLQLEADNLAPVTAASFREESSPADERRLVQVH